jgi:NADH-quinone oxidoreductase subunit L
MLLPLAALALLSLAGGFLFRVPEYLQPVFPLAEGHEDATLMAISTMAGLLGIFLAWLMYVARPGMAEAFAGRIRGLYTLVLNKYYVDEIYGAAVVRPLVDGSRTVLWKGVDVGVIDGAVNGIAERARGVGSALRLIQSGNIRSYATWVLFGSVLVIVGMAVAGGLR